MRSDVDGRDLPREQQTTLQGELGRMAIGRTSQGGAPVVQPIAVDA